MPRAERVKKRETAIKTAFWDRFGKIYGPDAYLVLNHQDVRSSGQPDSSVHGHHMSSFWEFKHGTPNFSSPTIQELICARLARHSYCRYVIFAEHDSRLYTVIAHPFNVIGQRGRLKDIKIEASFDLHDFDRLASYINMVHHSLDAPRRP